LTVILIDPEGRRLAGLPPGDAGIEGTDRPVAIHGNGAGGGDASGDPAARAVHDLGFIEVSSVRDGVQIRVRPLLVSGPAATQLFFALADMRPSRVVLVRFDDDRRQWRHEICGHWRNALERMNALVFANDRLPSYLAAELDLGELETQPEQGLRELRRLWERSNRRLENGAAEVFAGLALHEQSLIVAADPPGDALRIVRLGASLHFYGRDWNGSAIGRALADQPDGVFAARIEANLRRSIALAQPLFHRVEATVRRSARTAVQVSYRRLVLPWRLADGRRAATSTVLLDQFIEIAG
jgi:hypothetical protein